MVVVRGLGRQIFFFFNDTATTEIYTRKDTLSLHDALPIFGPPTSFYVRCSADGTPAGYFVHVVDDFVRNPLGGVVLTGSMTYAITTDTTLANPVGNDLDLGTFVIQDLDGSGVAQAF